jgi:hypothetical protein
MRSQLTVFSLLFALSAPAIAGDWDEVIDGDLSDNRLAPTTLNLTLGSNLVSATQQGNAFGRDVDYLTTVVPVGTQLSQLLVTGYVETVVGNLAFLGVQAGSTFTVDFDAAKAGDLLGGTVIGNFSVNTNILPITGVLGGAIGFSPPLPPGSYTWWFNQTGDPSSVDMDFVIEGPITPIGTNYCTATNNSTGNPASIFALGSTTVADNDFTLGAENLPVGTPGLFFFGPNQVQLPFGEGFRCVGGSVQRLQRPITGAADGSVLRPVDFFTSPAVGFLTPGTTTKFQYWYRDPSGGSAGFNLSDGLSVSFL